MPDATFTRPDLTTFTRLDDLGLEVTGQLLEPDRAVLACRVVEPDDWCRRCGCQGTPRDTVTRELAHEPFWVATHDAAGHRPPLPVLRLRSRVASGHHRRGRSRGPRAPAPGCAGVWSASWSSTCRCPASPRAWRSPGTPPTTRLDIFEREGLIEHVRTNAPLFRQALERLGDLPIVGDVRGEGYFYGIELVKDKVTKETFDEGESERLLRGYLSHALYDAGLYCRADDRGDPVIQLAPPLTIGPAEFDDIEQRLRSVLEKATDHL